MEHVQTLHPDSVVRVMKGTQVLNVINVRTLNFFSVILMLKFIK